MLEVDAERHSFFTQPFPLEHGAVAQLEERYNGIVEVVGSIPIGSTSLRSQQREE